MPNYIKVVLVETKEFGHFVLQREGMVTKRKSFPVSDRKAFVGTEREARTPDSWFWRPVLYQLS